MIVADASVVVDFLLGPGSEAGDRLSQALRSEPVAVPHLLDVEVGNALRHLENRRELPAVTALDHLAALGTLPLQRYPHALLLRRAFELRRNVSIYDGIYLALAEALDVPFLTADVALATVPGCLAEVELVRASR